jgi:hypothetical protein
VAPHLVSVGVRLGDLALQLVNTVVQR